MLASPVMLSLYRPATDNDNREKVGGAKVWKKAGLDKLAQRALSVKTSARGGRSEVELLNARNERLGTATFIYTLKKDGALDVQTYFVPDTAVVASLARVGLTFEMPDAYSRVAYLGRGEHETYIDRNTSGRHRHLSYRCRAHVPLLCPSAGYGKSYGCPLDATC